MNLTKRLSLHLLLLALIFTPFCQLSAQRTLQGKSSTIGTARTNGLTKTKNYSGTYRVTFTRILGDLNGTAGNDFYGTMGVYLEAKSRSGNITIKPVDKKPNRVLDIPKGRAVKKRKMRRNISPGTFTYLTTRGVTSQAFSNKPYQHSYEVDKVREFTLQGEAANADATLDFQFNLTEKRWSGDKGKWERVKIKVSDLKLNKEYFFYGSLTGGANHGICFKIEKR